MFKFRNKIKMTGRHMVKAIMDSYISFECLVIRKVVSIKKRFQCSDKKRKKILLLRKDVIGDFILFIPTLTFYRQYYKDADIHLVVNTVAKDLSPQLTSINTILLYDGKKFRSSFFYRRLFMHTLAKADYDIVVHAVYSREYIGDRMVRVTGAKETIAFKAESGDMRTDRQYTKLIHVPKGLSEPEINMYFAKEVTRLDCKITFPSLDITLFNKTDYNRVKETFNLETKTYCVLLAGAGAHYRTWQLEKFAEVADYISTTYAIKIVLSGGKSDIDKKLSIDIMNMVKNKNMVFDATGLTDLSGTAHLLQNSLFYFGSETGPMHLAVSIGTPVISILGGGHFGRFFPYGDKNICRYIGDDHATCRGDGWKCSQDLTEGEIAPCIRNITVMQAKNEIDALITYLQTKNTI